MVTAEITMVSSRICMLQPTYIRSERLLVTVVALTKAKKINLCPLFVADKLPFKIMQPRKVRNVANQAIKKDIYYVSANRPANLESPLQKWLKFRRESRRRVSTGRKRSRLHSISSPGTVMRTTTISGTSRSSICGGFSVFLRLIGFVVAWVETRAVDTLAKLSWHRRMLRVTALIVVRRLMMSNILVFYYVDQGPRNFKRDNALFKCWNSQRTRVCEV